MVLSGLVGVFFITIIDRIWFEIDYKKTEKGLEFLEHYHYGIALIAIAIITIESIPILAGGLVGMGAIFIYREERQKNCFAYKSSHFKLSSAIGIGLVAVTIAILSYLYLFN